MMRFEGSLCQESIKSERDLIDVMERSPYCSECGIPMHKMSTLVDN